MDYFEFFGLERKFIIDEKQLRKLYLIKSRENHPDFFVNDADKHDNALEVTSLINKAYETLKDKPERTGYIIELFIIDGILGKGSLNQMFLMEMMEWNERIMDASIEDDTDLKSKISKEFEELKLQISDDLTSASDKYDSNQEKSDLLRVQQEYLKMKYLGRIEDSLENMKSKI